MCVAVLALAAHPHWRLVVAANRDEFHDRPTAPLARWDNGVIAGRDLEAGGTWLGVNDAGRFALVTNFRLPGFPKVGLASRGGLVVDALLDRAERDGAAMNPFHLLHVSPDGASHRTNQPEFCQQALPAGLHGVSNGRFDQPWLKTQRLTAAVSEWLGQSDADPAGLFAALGDETPLPPETDSEGPDADFSPVFIRNAVYGTRCSTVVLVAADGAGIVIETRFNRDGERSGTTRIDFTWQTESSTHLIASR